MCRMNPLHLGFETSAETTEGCMARIRPIVADVLNKLGLFTDQEDIIMPRDVRTQESYEMRVVVCYQLHSKQQFGLFCGLEIIDVRDYKFFALSSLSFT